MLSRTINKTVDTRRFILGGLLLAGLAIVTVGVARAVVPVFTGPQMFEIQDGNVVDAVSPPGNPAPDWASLFDGSTQTAGPPPGPVKLLPMPAIDADHPGVASQFTVDPLAFDPLAGQEPVPGGGACLSGTGDPTVYTGAGGEKNGDVLTTDTWGAGSIPNNKDDLSNVYTAAYDRGDGKVILYFGLERVASNGSSHVDFEFYHNSVGLAADSPDAANGCEAGHFTGTRADGDIVITMDFDNGGAIGNPEVRRFDGTTKKYLVITPNANSIEVVQNKVVIDCGSWECRDTNGVKTPTLAINTFVEGYLDTGDPQVNFTGCLSSFNVHTRSSPSFTATLKDFALGNFDTCNSKAGQKFQDTNANGVKDTGEPGLPNWQIKLFADGGDGILSSTEFSTGLISTKTTDANGNYSFTGLNAGDYIVCEVAQATWHESLPNASTTNKADCSTSSTLGAVGWKVHLTASTHEINNDFGNYQNATKTGMKFQDTNANGVKDVGEPGLQNWVINAYADTDSSGTLSSAEFTAGAAGTSTTDASGNYSIGGLTPGKYVVCEVLKAGWIQSFPGGADECTGSATLGADGYAITLTSGQTDADNDFGNYQNATKTGMKFNDLNANGVKDAGEPGLQNWVINAYADGGDGVLSLAEFTAGAAGTSTTDASGNYSIGGLTPGKYVVCEVLKTSWIQSFPGGADECTGSATLGADGYAITLTSGQTDADNDFGNYQNATKTGMKFQDTNANGVKDAGEPGLATWVINAYADTVPDGVLSVAEFTAGPAGTSTTDASGNYSIGGLTPGKYVVCEVLKTSWIQSFPGGADECTGSATLGADGYAITLTSGQTDADNDFGNYQNATKTGMKFQDTNANGVKDAGEPGLATWVINAYADTVPDGVLSVAEFTAGPAGTSTTDASGNYSIGGLTPGKYVVCEVLKASWIQSFPGGADECTGSATLGADGYAITLTSGQTDADNDFGNYQNATKTGMKFQDTNANGVKDAGEPGLATWVINAYADTVPDGVLSVAEFTAGPAGTSTTDASGNYSIGGLTPGKYVVCEVLKASWIQSFPGGADECTGSATLGADGYAITLTSGQTDADNDFGNYQNATKTGMKFNDLNANGVKDAGEPGLATWVINAYADTVPDGVLSVAEFTAGPAGTSTTDASGNYSIGGLTPGKYVVCEVLKTSWIQSFPGGADECTGSATLGADGYAITLTSGQTDADNDFGNFQAGTKSGVKFNDLNNNGTKDAGEPGLNGWEIRAYADANGNGVLDAGETFVSQTTATVLGVDGVYSFTLNPGKYVVCEVLQTGWHQSRPSGNTICSADSSLGAAGFPVTIISGASHPDNDFGNNKLFRLIILTCSETTQTLVQSLVDTDGDFTTLGDQKTTIGPTPPSLGSESEAALQQYLCNLGGAQYNNLQADDYTKTTRIPKP